MQSITLNITNLNNSLQVGDLIYAVTPVAQGGAEDQQGFVLGDPTGQNNLVGVLRNIDFNVATGTAILTVDDTVATLFVELGYTGSIYTVGPGDFIMFSKNQAVNNTSLLGYYAKVELKNNSLEHAELFAVSSEIAPSSK